MTPTGRHTRSSPVEYQLAPGGKILRFERLPDGRRRRLVEDERSHGEVFIATDFAELENRFGFDSDSFRGES